MHFSFQDQFYEQVKGAAMGSPVSPIVANLYMAYFEQKTLSTAPTSRFWQRNVDDTCHPEGSQQTGLPTTHQQYSLCHTCKQWRTRRRMVPSPSWTPL